jgi:hypothetical protein
VYSEERFQPLVLCFKVVLVFSNVGNKLKFISSPRSRRRALAAIIIRSFIRSFILLIPFYLALHR